MPVSRSAERDTRSCLPIRTQSRRSGREERVGWLGADDPLGAIPLLRLLGLAEYQSSQDSREPLAASVDAVLRRRAGTRFVHRFAVGSAGRPMTMIPLGTSGPWGSSRQLLPCAGLDHCRPLLGDHDRRRVSVRRADRRHHRGVDDPQRLKPVDPELVIDD